MLSVTMAAGSQGSVRCNPDLNLELVNSSGTVVATGTATGASAESLTYSVTGMGAYPATRGYTLRVNAPTLGSTYTLSSTWPVTADVDVELYNPSGTRVANASGSSAKPETITYNATATGNYSLRVLSKNHSAAYTGSASYNELAYADVAYRLKDPSGAVVATGSTINHRATSGGTWTLELVNNSTTLTVPSFSADTRLPRTHTTTTLQLKNQAGTVVAENTSSDKPKPLTTTVAPGQYSLVVATQGGPGTGTLTASYPGRPARQVITYDAYDHATSVDDGATLVSEVLSPSGRVIRRTVRDVATGDVSEDALVGYEDDGDSPSYSKPVGGGAVTTYLDGVVYEGTTGSWKLTNLHGDIVGATDTAGAFTAASLTDEFGIGTSAADRLGWLGRHSRFGVGGSLGIIRMGIRLYDPTIGRFLEVDPVPGGCSNDYAYVHGDPINETDLSGEAACRAQSQHGYGTTAKVKRIVDKRGRVYWEFRISVGGLDRHFAFNHVVLGIAGSSGRSPAHGQDEDSRMPGLGFADYTAHTKYQISYLGETHTFFGYAHVFNPWTGTDKTVYWTYTCQAW